MRVFLAGATGVIGIRLVPLLVSGRHVVAGMTRSADKTDAVAAAGATPVVCDVFDLDRLVAAVLDFRTDVVLDQLTDLPDDPAQIPATAAANNRIRREGTRNLVTAAAKAGGARLVAQSVAWPLPGDAATAVDDMEATVLAADGVVIRYGQFYGPQTYYGDTKPPSPRIHVDDAARRTVPLLTAESGVFTLTEDDE